MKKLFYILAMAILTPLLSGCPSNGSSASPPPWLPQTAGDGRIKLEWTPTSGVDYWLFAATDPGLTAFNWTGLPHAYARINAPTPFYMCGLINDLPYYFATNGRTNGGPGGTSSPTITATPHNASASSYWNAGNIGSATNLNGVGYVSLSTCSNNTTSAAGSFAAVGLGGAIFTSSDGKTWGIPTNPPSGFTTDLFAVTGYAANQNNPVNPALRWVAVGDGGASVYSLDDISWAVGNPFNSNSPANPGNHALRSIIQVAGTFYAVGDAGTILSSTDGITWSSHTATSGTTKNLNGVTHAGIYVAVGDNGTILTSGDGNSWAVKTPSPAVTGNLRQVTSFTSIYGSIYVAVGDAGTVVTSKDGGTTWITQNALSSILPTPPDLVGIVAESRAVDTTTVPAKDTALDFVSTAQFVAIDSAGITYTSVNGYNWTAAPASTGISCTLGTSCLNPLVSSGFGYVAAGDGGATAYAF